MSPTIAEVEDAMNKVVLRKNNVKQLKRCDEKWTDSQPVDLVELFAQRRARNPHVEEQGDEGERDHAQRQID